MSVTRKQIRIAVSDRCGWYKSILATSGTTSTLVDTENLRDTGSSDYDHEDAWFKCTSAAQAGIVGKVRRAASYSKSSGTVTFGNALSATITAGDVFEEHQVDPDLIDRCINAALRRCTTVKRDLLTYSAGETQIALTGTYPWIVAPEYVLGLRYRLGTVANKYTFREVWPSSYKVTEDEGSISLEFYEPPATGTGIALELKSIGPYVTTEASELSTDAATTNCPLDWIVAMTTVELISRLGKNADLQARAVLRLDKAEAVMEAETQTLNFAPPINYEVKV